MVIAKRGERNDFESAFPGFFPVCPLCLLKVTDRERFPDLLSRSAVYSLRGSLRQSILRNGTKKYSTSSNYRHTV